jgi:RNA polymerase sigma factor (sigma-70 family)
MTGMIEHRHDPMPGEFPATRWSMVAAVRRNEGDAPRALAEICRAYWWPLYSFARRSGMNVEDAQDAVQGFFAALIEREGIGRADAERGRLRTFFLAAFKNHMADEYDRRTTWRRGGRTTTVSIDEVTAEERYANEPRDEDTPEKLFQRQWALLMLQRALETLMQERTAAGRREEMEVLRPFLDASGLSGDAAYEQAAQALGMTVANTRVVVHRLRHRYRRIFQDTVAATLESEDPAAVEEEMRALLAALS